MATPINQLRAQYDALPLAERETSSLPHQIYLGILAGVMHSSEDPSKTTGSSLADFAIWRAGTYDPKLTTDFERFDRQIASHVGDPVMLVETTGMQDEQPFSTEVLGRQDEQDGQSPRESAYYWRTLSTTKTYYVGCISDSKPILSPLDMSWAIPTESYAKHVTNPPQAVDPEEGLELVEGILPVHDFGEAYLVDGRNSALVRRLLTPESGEKGSRTRVAKEMSLSIGIAATAAISRKLASHQRRLLQELNS